MGEDRWKRRAHGQALMVCAALLHAGCPQEKENADGGEAQGPDEGGPQVLVVSPAEALDPTREGVLVASTVEVLCNVKPSSPEQRIDPNAVTISVAPADGASAPVTSRAVETSPETYSASVPLDTLESGTLRFTCTADDTSSKALTGSHYVDVLYDRGPDIEFTSPAAGAALARSSEALVLFRVTPHQLAGNDVQAALKDVTLSINGRDVSSGVSIDGDSYSYTTDLSDTKQFPTSTTELHLEVRATNQRAPEPAVRVAELEVAIDAEGPAIDITTPDEAQIVGQRAEVVAKVEDLQSGLKEGSLRTTVTVDDEVDVFPMVSTGQENVYAASFQTGKYVDRAQLTINVIAQDRAGNESRLSRIVFVDPVPPYVSLDPQPMRLAEADDDGVYECSAPFDPVGSDAVSDLESRATLFARYRTLVWERGIELEGQTIVHLSDIEDESVAMFVQGNRTIPLIIDSDADGICDQLLTDPDPVGPENDPVKVELAPVSPKGKPFPGTTAPAASDPSAEGICELSTASSEPDTLCVDSTMTYVLRHSAKEVGNALYAVHPTSSGVGCTGDDWQATVDGGWVCVASTARDKSGNVGISQPLRVCYDVPTGACDSAGAPPSCTDGCTMPAVFVEGGPRYIIRR